MDALGEGLVRVPLVDELPLREAEVFAEEILLQALLEVRELSPGGCDRLGDIPRFRLCLLVHVESCDLVREAEPRVHDSGLVELLPEGCNGDGAGVGEVLVPGVLDLQPSVAGLVEGSRPVLAQEDRPQLPDLRLSRHFRECRAPVALGYTLPQLRLARAAPADVALYSGSRDRPVGQEDPSFRPREMADEVDEGQ